MNLSVLNSIFAAGPISLYKNFTGGVPNAASPATQNTMGFNVGGKIVIAQIVSTPQTYTLNLSGVQAGVCATLKNSQGIKQTFSYTHANGALAATMNLGNDIYFLEVGSQACADAISTMNSILLGS